MRNSVGLPVLSVVCQWLAVASTSWEIATKRLSSAVAQPTEARCVRRAASCVNCTDCSVRCAPRCYGGYSTVFTALTNARGYPGSELMAGLSWRHDRARRSVARSDHGSVRSAGRDRRSLSKTICVCGSERLTRTRLLGFWDVSNGPVIQPTNWISQKRKGA